MIPLLVAVLIGTGPAMATALAWDYLRAPTDDVLVRLAALAEANRRVGIHVHDWEVETTSRMFIQWHRCKSCPARRMVK